MAFLHQLQTLVFHVGSPPTTPWDELLPEPIGKNVTLTRQS